MAEETVSLHLGADADDLKREVNEAGDAVDDLAGRTDEAAQQTEQSLSGATSAWEDHSGAISGAAAAVGAMGLAVEGLARSQQDTRAIAGRLANALEGETTDSVMGLAAEIHNATTDLDELVVMMETGRQQGIRSADALQDYALFWDMVGDATGESAAMLAESSVALRAVGIAAGDEGQALGAFGFIARETSGDVGEFLRFLERTGPELRGLGADIDDAAAILGILEHEFGMAGRTARQEFRTAVNESDGTLAGLLDTLGIGQGVFAEYTGQVEASSGVIEENAAAFADSRTTLQELSASLEAFLAQHSGLVDSMSTLSPVLMGAGGTVFALRQLSDVVGATRTRMAGMANTAPRAAGALRGVGAAAAGAVAVWAMDEALASITQTLVEWQQGPVAAVDDMTLALEGLAQTGQIPDSVAGSLDNLAESLEIAAEPGMLGRIQRFADDLPGSRLFSPGAGLRTESLERADTQIRNLDAAMAEAVRSGNDAALAEALDQIAQQSGLTGDALDELIRDRFPEYAKALDAAELASGDTADASSDLEGALSDLEDQFGDNVDVTWEATDALGEYMDRQRAATDPVFGMLDALHRVDEAQQSYNDALEEHGPHSAEAERAAVDLARAVARAEQAALDGDLSFDEFTRQLDIWVDQGLISAEAAGIIRDRVAEARGEAERFQGTYTAEIDVPGLDTTIGRLRELNSQIRAATGTSITVDERGNVHRRAHGGPLDAFEPAIVGEFGREIFMPQVPGIVLDAPTTDRLTGDAGRAGNTFHAQINLADGSQADRLVRRLERFAIEGV